MVKQEAAALEEEEVELEEEVEMEMGGDGLVKNNKKHHDDGHGHGHRACNTMRAKVMNSIRNNPKTYTSILIFMFVSAIVLAIVLDLLLVSSSPSASSVQEIVQVTSVSLDVSNPVPVANVEVIFNHHVISRLSRVEPLGMTCTLDKAGAINVSATKQNDNDVDTGHYYTHLVHVTCPEQDVDAHAALLWDVLTKKDSTRLGDFHCSATVKVYLGHVVPVTHTVSFDFSGDDLVQSIQEMKEQATTARETKETIVAVKPEDAEEDMMSDGSLPPSISIHKAHLNQMEIGIRLDNDHLPDFVYTMTPALNVKLPPMSIVVKPSGDSAGIELYTEGLEAAFVKNHNQNHHHHQELVFGIASSNTESSSKSSKNPAWWFGPIIGLLHTSSQEGTTVEVSVDAGVSFLETLIGEYHRFNVHFQQENGSGGTSSLLESARRRRRDIEDADVVMSELEQEMQNRQQAVMADCMSVDNESNDDFEFSMCWLFQLSKGFAFVGNMTLYDYFVSALTETTWEASSSASVDPLQNSNSTGSGSSGSWLKVDTSAMVEVGSDRDVMNVTGGMLLNVTDDVQLKMTLLNDGEIWPFEAFLLCDAVVDENNIFTMTMSQASFNLEDELLADATGSVRVDMIQQTTDMFINDPNMQFRSESSVVDNTTMTSTTTYILFGETLYNFVTDGRFENETFHMSMNETVSDTYFTSLYHIVDGGLIARTASAWNGESVFDTVMEWRTATDVDRQTFVASIIDPSMEFIVQGALLNDGVVLGNSTMGWYTQDFIDLVWDSNMEAKWKVGDMDQSVSFEMELVDDVMAYRLASALAGGPSMGGMGIDYALEYLTFELEEEPFVDWKGRLLVDFNNAPLLPELYTAWNITLDLDDRAFDYQLGLGTRVRLKEGQAKVVLDYLTFVLQEIQHVDMNGEFKLQLNESIAKLKLQQDTAELDFVADFITSWFSNSSGVGGQFDKATLTVGPDLYMDIETGQVITQGLFGSLLIASNPLAKLQLGTGVNYASFVFVEWNDMLIGWDGETFFDIHGHFMLDPSSSIRFFIEDSTSSLDFTHNITIGWESQSAYNASSVQSTFWVEPLLRVGSTTYFDSAALLQMEDDIEYGQWGMEAIDMIKESLANGVFSVTSAPAAELQMGMVFSYNLSTSNYLFNELKLEWDDVHVGWQDKTFFDIHGHSTLDRSSVEFFVEDSTSLDFYHNFSSRWFAEVTPSGGVLWGGFLDEALLRVGPTVYLDSAGSFAWEIVELDAIGLLNFTSTPRAALQLGMGMKLNYFAAADQFRVLLDRVQLGWKDEMYFESPGTIKRTGSLERKEIHFDDVSLVLVGVGELTTNEKAAFETLTAEWFEGFFAQNEGTVRRILQGGKPSGGKIYDVETTITVTGQDVGEKTVNGETFSVNTLSYNQTLIYMATDEADAAREYALLPFSIDKARSQYESGLIYNIGAFSNLQLPMETPVIKTNETEVPGDNTQRAADTDGGDVGLSPGALAGIVVAAVLAVLVILGVFAFLRWKHSKYAAEDEDPEHGAKPEMALKGEEEEEEEHSW